jgi:hypothetical protein
MKRGVIMTRAIRITKKGEQKQVADTPHKDAVVSLVSVFKKHSVFAAVFQGYHNILEKPDSVEYKDGKSLTADLYSVANTEKRAVKWVCAQFIEQNKLDWTINRFYNVVKSIHSREEGVPRERKEQKMTFLEEARKKAMADNPQLTPEQLKGVEKVAAFGHKKTLYVDYVKDNFDLDELIERAVIGKILKFSPDKQVEALDLVIARLVLYRAEVAKLHERAATVSVKQGAAVLSKAA